jgi:signal transduction histidine kinase
VLQRTNALTDLAEHLQTARDDERARLARDLHDELGALLTAAKLDVARMRPKLQQSAPELLPRLTHLTEFLNSGIALKRRIIEDLRPSTLSSLGLCPALEILCTEFAEGSGLVVEVDLQPVRLEPGAELTVFRLVQEALTNITKYAQASRVHVRLKVDDDQAWISVTDDGVGFDPHQIVRSSHGLLGMRYRVSQFLGQCGWTPHRGAARRQRPPAAAQRAPASA